MAFALRAGIMPLSEFSEDDQADIAWAAVQPVPPPRWIRLELAQIPSAG